jgi:hypothetical protein
VKPDKHICGSKPTRLSQSFSVAEVDWLVRTLTGLKQGEDVRDQVKDIPVGLLRKIQNMRWRLDRLLKRV